VTLILLVLMLSGTVSALRSDGCWRGAWSAEVIVEAAKVAVVGGSRVVGKIEAVAPRGA